MSEQAPVQVIREGDTEYEQVGLGFAVSRSVTALGITELGGGWSRFSDSSASLEWHLHYDEVLFVVKGRIMVDHNGSTVAASAGDALVLRKGTDIIYRADAGTLGFFVLYPADWANRLATDEPPSSSE